MPRPPRQPAPARSVVVQPTAGATDATRLLALLAMGLERLLAVQEDVDLAADASVYGTCPGDGDFTIEASR